MENRKGCFILSKARHFALRALIVLLIAALAPLLGGCGYWAVEARSIQVGDAVIRVTQIPEWIDEQ